MSNEFSSYFFKVNNALKKNIMGKRKKETFFNLWVSKEVVID